MEMRLGMRCPVHRRLPKMLEGTYKDARVCQRWPSRLPKMTQSSAKDAPSAKDAAKDVSKMGALPKMLPKMFQRWSKNASLARPQKRICQRCFKDASLAGSCPGCMPKMHLWQRLCIFGSDYASLACQRCFKDAPSFACQGCTRTDPISEMNHCRTPMSEGHLRHATRNSHLAPASPTCISEVPRLAPASRRHPLRPSRGCVGHPFPALCQR